MDVDCNYNAITLYKSVKKLCNRSATVMTDDVLGNMVEVVYNLLLIKGDEYQTLSKYLEATKQCLEVLKGSGFNMATNTLRDLYMGELASRNQDSTALYRSLNQ